VPKKVLSSLKIVLVSHMDEVLKKALLVKNPEHIFQGPGNKSKKELKSSFYFRKKPTYMTRAPLVGTA